MKQEFRRDSRDNLTKRELEILSLVYDGLTNEAIGKQLFLATETVRWYTKQIYSKLGVHGRTEALAEARKLNLLPEASQGAETSNKLDGTERHNLPVQIFQFFGRQQEFDSLSSLLDANSRLISIVGPGGIGKSRLAVEFAGTQLRRFSHGVYFVALDALEAPEQIAFRIADVLSYQFLGQDPAEAQLVRYLRDKQMLLVLDNFEHLVEGAALVSKILEHASQIQILVTSREKLDLLGETVFPLSGLLSPTAAVPQETIAQFSAVRLFCEIARRAVPGFQPARDDWKHIGQICALVEGMPLAIILAAGWSSSLSVHEIADELTRALDFLGSGPRNLPMRHQSIRTVFESTLRRLTDKEREAFARLSVFHNGFTRHAAQLVTGTTLEILSTLMRKTLLRRDPVSGYFGMHVLLHQFAEEHFAILADREIIKGRHAEYYMEFLGQQREDLKGANERTALDEIDKNFANIQAAWSWMFENNNTEGTAEALESLQQYFERHASRNSEAVSLYRRALDKVEPLIDDHDSAQAAHIVALLKEGMGFVHQLNGEYDTSRQFYDEAYHMLPQSAYIERARLQRKLSSTWTAQRNPGEALKHLTSALSDIEAMTVGRDAAWTYEWLEIQIERLWSLYLAFELEGLSALSTKMEDVLETVVSPTQSAKLSNNLSLILLIKHRGYMLPDQALRYFERAFQASVEANNLPLIIRSQSGLGFCHLLREELDPAITQLQESLRLSEELNYTEYQLLCLTYLTLAYRMRRDVERVRELAERSLQLAQAERNEDYGSMARANLAWVHWHEHNFELVRAYTTGDFPVGWFEYLRRFPLIDVALAEDAVEAALEHARVMTLPSHKGLPEKLTALLFQTLETKDTDTTRNLLRQVINEAHETGYF